MDKVRHSHSTIAPAIGKYSRSIRAGNMLFISGCTAVGTEAEDQDVMRQACHTMNRVIRIVQAEGGTYTDIVKLVIYVTNMEEFRSYSTEFDEMMDRYFHGVYPTSTLIATPALAVPTLQIEIDATAVF